MAVLFAVAVMCSTRASAQAAAACPNAGVLAEDAAFLGFEPEAAQQPMCRGFELVSPPYKEGFAVTQMAAVSEDGSRIIVGSLGAFAETPSAGFEGDFEGPKYAIAREAGGWSVSALDPDPARFPGQGYLGASADLTRTLWKLREPHESIYEADLYVREADGSFVKVGPLVPPSISGPAVEYTTAEEQGGIFVDGTSSTLSRVLFTLVGPAAGDPSFLWPGDTTTRENGESLYEYVGTGNSRPTLVGVSDGATVVDGKMIPVEALISDCGVKLGNGPLGARSAVSASGQIVFFTALSETGECKGPEVNELYARIDGSETVHISEPTQTQCRECRTGYTKITAVEKPAVFQGASEDGSKVFFTTEQQLLGTEGESLYEYDFDNVSGAKLLAIPGGVVDPAVLGVMAVSNDGSRVYFISEARLAGENGEEREPIEGKPNLYVFERDAKHPEGDTTFVATLSLADEGNWSSRAKAEAQAQTTPNGRFLVFQSHADLTPDDSSGEQAGQIFEYDALSERLVRVSIGQRTPGGYECSVNRQREGYNCDGNSEAYYNQALMPERAPLGPGVGLAISNDGSRVFFESADGLTPQALDDRVINEDEGEVFYAQNVYEYRSSVASGGAITDGNVHLVSAGNDISVSHTFISGTLLYGTDASGGDVFFRSGVPLVGQDTDTQLDIYDARVDGGFPEPASPLGCAGEACLGAPISAPPFGSPVSSSLRGEGNIVPTVAAGVAVEAPLKTKRSKRRKLTRAQKLGRALKRCTKRPRRTRPVCRERARKRYGGKRKSRRRRKRRVRQARTVRTRSQVIGAAGFPGGTGR